MSTLVIEYGNNEIYKTFAIHCRRQQRHISNDRIGNIVLNVEVQVTIIFNVNFRKNSQILIWIPPTNISTMKCYGRVSFGSQIVFNSLWGYK